MTTFTFITDNAHGWLRVEAAEWIKSGFRPDDFSRYSYRDLLGNIYLEEDCDAVVIE